MIDGNPEDAYRILPHYGRKLERSNAGTHVVIERSADIPEIEIELAGYDFRRVFWMFGPVARAFRRTLRLLLTLDGTFLKGKYPGVLLVATAIDDNQQLMCLAYAVVCKEDCMSSRVFEHMTTHTVVLFHTRLSTTYLFFL